MTQKLWQTKPKLSYSKEVLDIVQFGSSIIEDSSQNDIDIAVLFHKIPLKEQLGQAQSIKKQIQEKTSIPVHINAYDWYTLLDQSNFARENIVFYGRSIITGEYFSQQIGLKPVLHISYILKDMKKKDKIRFNYMLSGKKGEYGLLRRYNGRLLKPGLIEVPPEYGDKFSSAIKEFKVEYSISQVFISEERRK